MRFTGEWEGGIIFSSCFTNQKHPSGSVFPILEHPQHPEEIFRDSSIIHRYGYIDILYLYSSNRQEVREEKAVWEK